MAAFGVGTIPSLTAVLIATRPVPARMRSRATRLAAIVIRGIGVFMLLRTRGALAPACHAAPATEPSPTTGAQPVP